VKDQVESLGAEFLELDIHEERLTAGIINKNFLALFTETV
jgi:NAD/NADP transhydrogenase alpha subunit